MTLVPGSYYGIINALTAWYLWDITRPLPWYYRYCWYSMAWWYNSYIHVCIGHHPWARTPNFISINILYIYNYSIINKVHGIIIGVLAS